MSGQPPVRVPPVLALAEKTVLTSPEPDRRFARDRVDWEAPVVSGLFALVLGAALVFDYHLVSAGLAALVGGAVVAVVAVGNYLSTPGRMVPTPAGRQRAAIVQSLSEQARELKVQIAQLETDRAEGERRATGAQAEAEARVQAEIEPVRRRFESEMGRRQDQVVELGRKRTSLLEECEQLAGRRRELVGELDRAAAELGRLQAESAKARNELARAREQEALARRQDSIDLQFWCGEGADYVHSLVASEGVSLAQVHAREDHVRKVRENRGKPWAEREVDRYIAIELAAGNPRRDIQQTYKVGVSRIHRVRREMGDRKKETPDAATSTATRPTDPNPTPTPSEAELAAKDGATGGA